MLEKLGYSFVMVEDGKEPKSLPKDAVVNEGEFIWLWQDPPIDYAYARRKVTEFYARPYSREQSAILEEAFLCGKETVNLTIEGKTYIVNFVNSRMFQVDADNVSHYRRVWRVGSKIKNKLSTDLWPNVRKFRNYPIEVPPFWECTTPGSHRLVTLSPEKDREEYDWVLNKIKQSVAHHDECEDPLMGYGGVWYEKSRNGRPSITMPPAVHFVDGDGEVHREYTKAFHIAAICRVENPSRYLSYCVEKNRILDERGGALTHQQPSRYLVSHPVSTHDDKDDDSK